MVDGTPEILGHSNDLAEARKIRKKWSFPITSSVIARPERTLEEIVDPKRRLGRVVPALITIIPIGDPNESTIFKSEKANKSIWS